VTREYFVMKWLKLPHKKTLDNVSESVLLQPLRWRCVECVIHQGRNVREEQHRYTV